MLRVLLLRQSAPPLAPQTGRSPASKRSKQAQMRFVRRLTMLLGMGVGRGLSWRRRLALRLGRGLVIRVRGRRSNGMSLWGVRMEWNACIEVDLDLRRDGEPRA